jgi:integrase/recombinase XerD
VRFLESVSSLKARVALTTGYAAGFRVSEVAALNVCNVESGRMVMRIEHAEGGKERYGMLSAPLLGILRSYLRLTRPPIVSVSGPDPG